MKLTIRLSVLMFAGLVFWFAARGMGRESESHLILQYRVEAVPGDGLLVELRTDGLSADHPEFRLLDGWGVLQDQSQHIEDLTAIDGSGITIPLTRSEDKGRSIWRMRRRPQGEVTLRYRVRSYDPYLSPEATFVNGDRMLLLGYSVFLLPAQAARFDPLSTLVQVRAPEGWPLWSSWPGPSGFYRPASTHDLWSGVVAGGGYHASELGNDAVSLTVLTEGSTQGVTGLSIANRLLAVLREMHQYFGTAPRGEDLRVLAVFRMLPRLGNTSVMTGNSEEGAFLCLATPDRYRNADPLTALATHECLHFYLGGAVSATPEPPYRNAPDLIWFMEGMTEYLTFQILERAGIIPPEELVKIAIQKDEEYRSVRRAHGMTLADAARRMEDMEIYSVVYSRGYLVARMIDHELSRLCGEGSLEIVLRDLFENQNYYRTGKAIDSDVVRARFEAVCPGIGDLILRYAEGEDELPSRNEKRWPPPAAPPEQE